MERGLTVRLDEDMSRTCRVLATPRGWSVSGSVAHEFPHLVDDQDAYRRACDRALEHLEQGFRLGGGPLPDRRSLHER